MTFPNTIGAPMALRHADPLGVTRNPVGVARRLSGGNAGRLAPGPVGYPVVGVLPAFNRDPFTYLREAAAQYGDVFRVPLPLMDMVCVNHPDHVAHIMNDSARYSMMGPLKPMVHTMFGKAIPGLDGDEFRQRRRLITPMFRHNSLNDLSVAIVDEFTQRIDKWQRWAGTGQTIDLQHEIAWLTMPAFLRAMFGISVTDAEIERLDRDIRSILQMFSAMFFLNLPPNLLPIPGGENLVAAFQRTRAWIEQHVEHRLANPIEGTDLLQILLDGRDENGDPISRKDLLAELLILIAGGYETVVASTSWTLALLRDNPAAHRKLLAEVDALGGQPPTFADLGRLEWVKACFDEAQRLQGHPFHPRIALADDEVGGYHIRKGTVVGVSVYALHRDARWWPDPDVFDPTRFTDKAVVAARPSMAFIPFGAGPHRCIGSQMGYMNAQFILTLLHQRYTLTIDPAWRPKHASTFSTTIKGGLPVQIERRKQPRPRAAR